LIARVNDEGGEGIKLLAGEVLVLDVLLLDPLLLFLLGELLLLALNLLFYLVLLKGEGLVHALLGPPGNHGRLSVGSVQIGAEPGLSAALNPRLEWIRSSLVRVEKLDLLGLLGLYEGDGARSGLFGGVDWILPHEVEVDGAVQALDLVRDEEGDLDVLVLVELEELLLHYLELVGVVLVQHHHEFLLALLNKLVGIRALVNHVGHRVQVIYGHVGYFLGVAALEGLELESHQHQVEQLLHAALVEPHDARVGQSHEDLACFNERDHLLRPEDLIHELGNEHGFNNVLQHFLAPLIGHILTPKSLVQDVDHLTAQVDDDDGENVGVSNNF